MITHILHPYICEDFKNDEHYRNGHLRVINALPTRQVSGLHIPDIKRIAKTISKKGCEIVKSDNTHHLCNNGTEVIKNFENEPNGNLCYEETLIWGFLINLEKTTLNARLKMLEKYIPTLDNWAVCDSFCSNAKWMEKAEKDILWQFIERWFKSKQEFEVRFALVSSMCYFIDEEWLKIVLQNIDNINYEQIKSEYKTDRSKGQKVQNGTVKGTSPYYVRMGVAWFLATALAKYPDYTRSFIHSSHIPDDVIRLYIRKARESFRTRTIKAL